MTIQEILDKVESYPCSLVEITGGEPLLQDETSFLVKKLLEQNKTVLIETNGSMDVSGLDSRCIKILDIKCPSSRMNSKNVLGNLQQLNPNDQIKFVIKNSDDFDFAKNIIKLLPPDFPLSNVLFSPVSGEFSPDILSRWILEGGIGVRIHLQLHKILWPDKDRGV